MQNDVEIVCRGEKGVLDRASFLEACGLFVMDIAAMCLSSVVGTKSV
jgi:hypothetical protein